jgi:hypothetical protein
MLGIKNFFDSSFFIDAAYNNYYADFNFSVLDFQPFAVCIPELSFLSSVSAKKNTLVTVSGPWIVWINFNTCFDVLISGSVEDI